MWPTVRMMAFVLWLQFTEILPCLIVNTAKTSQVGVTVLVTAVIPRGKINTVLCVIGFLLASFLCLQLEHGGPVWKKQRVGKSSSVHSNKYISVLNDLQLLSKFCFVSEFGLNDRE